MDELQGAFTKLPLDILLIIFPYLDARSFLSLCSTCKTFQDPEISQNASYWRNAVRSTFRVPNQPFIQADGHRWRRLYKRMLTQSRVFTWGDNERGSLGRGNVHHSPGANAGSAGGRTAWPLEVHGARDLGIIADLQCGGWSTTFLTSAGSLFTYGTIDGSFNRFRSQGNDANPMKPTPLTYASGTSMSSVNDARDAQHTIKQFSSGRSHILGLSDTGRIWSWCNANRDAIHIKFLHIHVTEDDFDDEHKKSANDFGRARKVVAGWEKSSAYIKGSGIVIWHPVASARTGRQQGDVRPESDGNDDETFLVIDSAVVPNTAYQRPKGALRDLDNDTRQLGESVGEVLNYVILEGDVVFVTDLGKVFAAKITWNANTKSVSDPIELTDIQGNSEGKPVATDVQGAFRSFAIFKTSDEVTIAHSEHLRIYGARQLGPAELLPPRRIPALQKTGVISVAFGDWHFHALHSDGSITSYDTEPRKCGALGLGGGGSPTQALLRGMDARDRNLNRLCPLGYVRGRHVWFEQEKRQWLSFLAIGGRNRQEANLRLRMMANEPKVAAEVSEWVEQQGTGWDKRPGVREADEDGLGAYFVLSIAAAGWHSGALVLVNDDLVARVHDSCVRKDGAMDGTPTSGDSGAFAARPQPQNILGRLTQWSNSWVRWFLGLPDATEPTPGEGTQSPQPIHPWEQCRFPAKGYSYIWVNDDFPRLRLSSGVEMPGSVPFSEWRFDPPESIPDSEP